MKRYLFLLIFLFTLPVSLLAQDVIILKSVTRFECTGVNSGICHQERTIRINTLEGKDWATFTCPCDSTHHLTSFSGKYFDENNYKILELDKSDLATNYLSTKLTDGPYYHYCKYEMDTVPLTIKLEWDVRYSDLHSYPSFDIQPGYGVEVVDASYKIILTPANTLYWKAQNCDPTYVKGTDKGRETFQFDVYSLPALQNHIQGLPLNMQAPVIYFSPTGFDQDGQHCDLTSWPAYGAWLWQELQQSLPTLSDAIVQRLHQVTDTCATQRGKVYQLHRFLNATTQGKSSTRVLAIHMYQMLHAIGLPAEYAYVTTQSNDLMRDMVNMEQLDVAAIRVPLPADTLWLSFSNTSLPFDYVPADITGHEALILTPQRGIITRVPTLPITCHQERNVCHISIDSVGTALVQLQGTETGRCYENDLHLSTLTRSMQQQTISRSFYLPNAKFQKIQVTADDAHQLIDVDAECLRYCTVSDSAFYIPIFPYRYSRVSQREKEAYTLYFNHESYIHTDSVMMELPPAFSILQVPQDYSLTTPMGSYYVHFTMLDARHLSAVFSVTTADGTFGPELFEQWRSFNKELARASRSQLFVRRR